MSTFLQEELGVAMSGTKWEVANYTLWQSTRPNIVLFAPKQPKLAKSSTNGRYQVGVSVHRAQKPDGSVGIKCAPRQREKRRAAGDRHDLEDAHPIPFRPT